MTRVQREPESRVPALRVRAGNERPLADGDHVLYWMIAARRTGWNFGLERAVEWARTLAKPLLVLEPLRVAYPFASARFHRFVLDGMADHARHFAQRGIAYWPYVEPEAGAGQGLLEALGKRACVVVTDEYPTFFLPRMVAAAGEQLGVRLEVVDSNGLVPLAATPGAFGTAFAFRRWLQQHLGEHLQAFPRVDPLEGRQAGPFEVPRALARRWPAAPAALLAGDAGALAALPLDHTVPAVETRGGDGAAAAVLARFVAERLARYGEDRNHPDEEATSGLSPYLHFGHVAAHAVFTAVTAAEGWKGLDPRRKPDGRRGGFGASPSSEEFLDQLVTWRELGYGFAWHRADHQRYESLPAWARATLEEHATAGRDVLALETLEQAASGDEVWDAAQTELRTTGQLHNYLRMLWGKSILAWSPTPREALRRMLHLNDRYALDGRDPNSCSGIFWCLGRFDRPWGPKRAGFGTVRYMSSASTRRKLHLTGYLARFGPGAHGLRRSP
ncbi:MAG TPA: deoxyribodipyrimidine photolyase [Planctomycetota bacterium]